MKFKEGVGIEGVYVVFLCKSVSFNWGDAFTGRAANLPCDVSPNQRREQGGFGHDCDRRGRVLER